MLSILDSIVVSIPACHAGGRGSIPRRGEFFLILSFRTFRLELTNIKRTMVIIIKRYLAIFMKIIANQGN